MYPDGSHTEADTARYEAAHAEDDYRVPEYDTTPRHSGPVQTVEQMTADLMRACGQDVPDRLHEVGLTEFTAERQRAAVAAERQTQ